MKFSEFDQENWEELKPYFDTCLLPLTGLSGKEPPGEATHELEKLRDVLDKVEIPFKGRIVTYPAFHYISPQRSNEAVNAVCRELKQSAFRYVIVITANSHLAETDDFSEADLFLHPFQPENPGFAQQIQEMWKKEQ